MVRAIVLLAHLMEKDGSLGQETRARADKAAELATETMAPLLLMGWNYRSDTDLCISDAIAAYLSSHHTLAPSQVVIDRSSRDTVGDAVLSKKMVLTRLGIRAPARILIVTSGYHAARTLSIFRFVYGTDWQVEVVGVEMSATQEQTGHEKRSLEAFRATFAGVPSGDDRAIFEALIARHPFYNGAIHPVLKL